MELCLAFAIGKRRHQWPATLLASFMPWIQPPKIETEPVQRTRALTAQRLLKTIPRPALRNRNSVQQHFKNTASRISPNPN
jgi:hypothetical protein